MDVGMYMNETETTTKEFEGWAILELMGHRVLGGYVREVEIAGCGMLRIDVPAIGDSPSATQYYAPAAIYGMTPTTEGIARALAARNRPEPVMRWQLEPAAMDDKEPF